MQPQYETELQIINLSRKKIYIMEEFSNMKNAISQRDNLYKDHTLHSLKEVQMSI